MDPEVLAAHGVRPEWMFSVATASQHLVADAFEADPDQFRDAIGQFECALPQPGSPMERMVLRDRIIEYATKAGHHFHECFHRWFATPPCRKSPVEEAAAVWVNANEQPCRLLQTWRDVFLQRFDEEHRWPLPERAAAILRARFADSLTIAGLTRELGCARTRLIRSFYDMFGMSIGVYHTRVRLRHAAIALRQPASNVDATARDVGYRSTKNLYSALQSVTGLTPTQLRALSEREFHQLLESALTLRAERSQPRKGQDRPRPLDVRFHVG